MPITYRIDRGQNLILETWTGDIHARDLLAYWQRYLKDAEVLAIRRTVVDLRNAVIHFDGWQLHCLINSIVVPELQGRDWKTAIVVEHPVQFGVGRQYQAFAGSYSKDSIFDSTEMASNWLLRMDPPES